mmetsp:Transcript_18249/g.42704  ORF Transcript_18249/g.42704 Transcript_18249/m.42704 type:complete len:95 (-) Transcript_18249:12-296(-)
MCPTGEWDGNDPIRMLTARCDWNKGQHSDASLRLKQQRPTRRTSQTKFSSTCARPLCHHDATTHIEDMALHHSIGGCMGWQPASYLPPIRTRRT